MAANFNKNRRKGTAPSGAKVAAAVMLFVISTAVAGYVFLSSHTKNTPPAAVPAPVTRPVSPKPAVLPPESATLSPSADHSSPHQVQKKYPESDSHSGGATQSPDSSGQGRLAVIIDDMGSSMSEARSLAAIGVPLTFSVIPGLLNYRDVAAYAANSGIETMIHLPMQSKGWPERRLEANGLLLSMDDSDLRERVAAFMRDVPGAVGANNHMGSEFTEHEEKMRSVLESLRGKNLYFIDSVTSPHSVALKVARELGIRSGRRNVFLDNEQNRAYILGQLSQAVKIAKKSGAAIAICHPHPETISALASTLPGLAAQGVILVPASALVK